MGHCANTPFTPVSIDLLVAVAVKTPVFFCKLARMNVLTIGVQPQRWLRGADWLPAPEQLTVVSNLCLGPLDPGKGPVSEALRRPGHLHRLCQRPGSDQPPAARTVTGGALGQAFARTEDVTAQPGLGPDGKVLIASEEGLDSGDGSS